MERHVDIHTAGRILIHDRKLLVSRTKGKTIFINPGGKVQFGETVKEALIRELMEESTIRVLASDLEDFGTFYATAAGQEDSWVRMDMFMVKKWDGEPTPDYEIEEHKWVTSDLEPGMVTGSIFEYEVIPQLEAQASK